MVRRAAPATSPQLRSPSRLRPPRPVLSRSLRPNPSRRRLAAPAPRRVVGEIMLLIAVPMIAAFFLKSYVAQAFYIPSASMEPKLEVGTG